MGQPTFEAVARLPVVERWLEAFPKATGVAVVLTPPGVRRDANGALSLPIVVEGHTVAFLKAAPPSLRRQGVADLLRVFADNVVQSLQVLPVPRRDHELPCVARARQFIYAHLHEPIAVGQCARAAGYCADHFGRIFRRATGRTFTGYVARARVERAQQLLADPHARVTEVAFAAGFQSLPTFNRTFKALTGHSPTAWRAHLGAGI